MPPHSIANLRPWKPGESGNPRGAGVHTLKLAAQVRQISDGGREMIELLFSVMRGEPLPMAGRTPKGRRHGPPLYPSPELRVRCAEILLDRAYGKAKELIELVGEDAEAAQQQRLTSMAALTQEEREQLRALLQRGLERAARAGPSSPSLLANGQAAATGPDGRPPV